MGNLYLLMGVVIPAAVIPAAPSLMWKDQSWIAAAICPVLGLIVALIAWLVTAKKEFGVLSVACTGSNNPMLAGKGSPTSSPGLRPAPDIRFRSPQVRLGVHGKYQARR